MGRPRKNSAQPDAIERITESFWHLLEDHQLNEITIGMISKTANCNRGTFYYHFTDIDELIDYVIKREFFVNSMPQKLFKLAVNGNEEDFLESLNNPSSHRVCLIMERGGQSLAEERIRSSLVLLWQAILCCEDDHLSNDARLIIEYSSHGMMGLIRYLHQQNADEDIINIMPSIELIRDTSDFILEHISQAQGITRDELLERADTVFRWIQAESQTLNHASSNIAVVK